MLLAARADHRRMADNVVSSTRECSTTVVTMSRLTRTRQAHVLNLPIFYPRLCLFTFSASRSTEFVADPVDPIVIFMPEISRTSAYMGGTMHLGLRPAADRFPEG